MYWDAHACNDVADTSTEYRVHLPFSEWRVAGCALAYRVVTSLPLKKLLSRSCHKVISGGPPAIRPIHVKIIPNTSGWLRVTKYNCVPPKTTDEGLLVT